MDSVLASQIFQKKTDKTALTVQSFFSSFLEECTKDDKNKYEEISKRLSDLENNTIAVSFTDVEDYNQKLAAAIIEEYYRYYPYLNRALRLFIQERNSDVLLRRKEVYVAFKDLQNKQNGIRELRNIKVGTLLSMRGQVVRTHSVHPEITSGTFTCKDCKTEIKNVEQQFKYTLPTICRNTQCGNRKAFLLDHNKSVFVDFQKIRIQETQAELPRGSVPRTIDVVVRGEYVEQVQAGDRCEFVGTLVVVPDVSKLGGPVGPLVQSGQSKRDQNNALGIQGLKALGVRELTYRQAFLACHISNSNPTFGLELDENREDLFKDPKWAKVSAMASDKNIYTNLCNSLFPTIHGNEEIKRGILLQLFGGVPKLTEEGTSLRGDLNVCIVGDPSTAKSQFLKKVEEFSPRAVYTSGKASSAAGLTAAVVRDEETSEFVIEAGALMLADNGICCIDEFDKMEVRDQVAIHEAMEQQTISIAKAGVKATLNARTSILAAANPIGGRYDRTKPLRKNIALSAPIMSRFDLFFILVDECSEVTDYSIARRIVDLHTMLDGSITRHYSLDEIQRYIMFAKTIKPKISKEAGECMVHEYKKMRERDSCGIARSSWRITVRQLESLVRLSEALARLYCMDEVQTKHVKEAARLLNKSIIRVEMPDVNLLEDQVDENNDVTMDTETPATDEDPSSDPVSQSTQETNTENKMSYEEYSKIMMMLVMYLRRKEDQMEEDESEIDSIGVRRSELVAWYLEEVVNENEIDDTEELLAQSARVESVITRLITKDKVLIQLHSDAQQSSTQDDPVIVVHPDYVLDD